MISKYVRLLRPIAWITFLLPFAVGFGLGLTKGSSLNHMIFAFISFSFWMSLCFTVNAIADKDVDKFHDGRSKDMNLAKQPLVTGEISEKYAYILSAIFLIISLVFAWQINIVFFLMIVIVDIFSFIYSAPPFRFKARPVTDILCNAIFAGSIFVAGLSVGGANMNNFMIVGSFILAAIFYIPTVVTDYKFDKKAGLNNSAVFFGPKKLLRAIIPLFVLLCFVMLILIFYENIELRIIALLIIVYSFIFTLVSNFKLKGETLKLHENWILVPFLFISIGFVIYGFFKFLGYFVF